jgi:hypothetical protein
MSSATVDLVLTVTVTDSDADSDAVPVTHRVEKQITTVDEHAHRKGLLATATTRTLWDPSAAGEQIGTFRLMVLWADGALEVELTTANGDVDEALALTTLQANVPLVIGSDDGRNNYTTDAFAGDADVIDLIRIKNSSGANVRYNLLLVE